MGFPQYENDQDGNPGFPPKQQNYPNFSSTDGVYFDAPQQADPNFPPKSGSEFGGETHFVSNRNYCSSERSNKSVINYLERDRILLLKRKLLDDFDNSDARQPLISFDGNQDLEVSPFRIYDMFSLCETQKQKIETNQFLHVFFS